MSFRVKCQLGHLGVLQGGEGGSDDGTESASLLTGLRKEECCLMLHCAIVCCVGCSMAV